MADNADALVVVTEWKLFQTPDFKDLARRMVTPVLVDGRNIYRPETVTEAGFVYYGIARRPIADTETSITVEAAAIDQEPNGQLSSG